MSDKPAASKPKTPPSEAAHDRNTGSHDQGLAERSVNEPRPDVPENTSRPAPKSR